MLHHTNGMGAGGSTADYPHFCKDYMLFYFIHGNGDIKIEGNQYSIVPGDLVITNPSELFHCSVNHGVYHERIVLHIEESFADNFSKDCSHLFVPLRQREKGVGNHIPAQIVRECGIDKLLTDILELVKMTDSVSELLTVCKITELLTKLSRLNLSARPKNEDQDNLLIHQILSYLNTHYTKELFVSSVASMFGVHPSYLSHYFKEHTGMSMWNYVILRRLYHVNNLLRKDVSAEEACYSAGFQNYSNFYRLYKKNLGITPTQFKKQGL